MAHGKRRTSSHTPTTDHDEDEQSSEQDFQIISQRKRKTLILDDDDDDKVPSPKKTKTAAKKGSRLKKRSSVADDDRDDDNDVSEEEHAKKTKDKAKAKAKAKEKSTPNIIKKQPTQEQFDQQVFDFLTGVSVDLPQSWGPIPRATAIVQTITARHVAQSVKVLGYLGRIQLMRASLEAQQFHLALHNTNHARAEAGLPPVCISTPAISTPSPAELRTMQAYFCQVGHWEGPEEIGDHPLTKLTIALPANTNVASSSKRQRSQVAVQEGEEESVDVEEDRLGGCLEVVS